MKLIFKAVIVVIIVLYGCKDSAIVDPIERARINLQEGTIDGIKTGDDTTTVLKILGKPDYMGIGDADGFSYEYVNRNFPGVSIISVIFYNSIPGLILGDYRVTGIVVSNSYEGKSKEGIGIGTTRSEVINKLGNPAVIYEYGEYYHFTRSDGKVINASFTYNDQQKVIQIGVGI